MSRNPQMRRNQQLTDLGGAGRSGQRILCTLGQRFKCEHKCGSFEEQERGWCDWSVMSWRVWRTENGGVKSKNKNSWQHLRACSVPAIYGVGTIILLLQMRTPRQRSNTQSQSHTEENETGFQLSSVVRSARPLCCTDVGCGICVFQVLL